MSQGPIKNLNCNIYYVDSFENLITQVLDDLNKKILI